MSEKRREKLWDEKKRYPLWLIPQAVGDVFDMTPVLSLMGQNGKLAIGKQLEASTREYIEGDKTSAAGVMYGVGKGLNELPVFGVMTDNSRYLLAVAIANRVAEIGTGE